MVYISLLTRFRTMTAAMERTDASADVDSAVKSIGQICVGIFVSGNHKVAQLQGEARGWKEGKQGTLSGSVQSCSKAASAPFRSSFDAFMRPLQEERVRQMPAAFTPAQSPSKDGACLPCVCSAQNCVRWRATLSRSLPVVGSRRRAEATPFRFARRTTLATARRQ